VGTVALLTLASPILGLRLGVADESNHPEGTYTRQAYDLLAEGFGDGFNGPFLITTVPGAGAGAGVDAGNSAEAVQALRQALARPPGVAAVTEPLPDDPTAPEAFLMTLIPTTAPQAEATSDLVTRLRDDVIPATVTGTELEVRVTGTAAANIDLTTFLGRRVLVFFGVVLSLSFVLLLMVFRSLLVPLKAVIMNVLAMTATYGVVVAAFQWGWGGNLLGIAGTPIEPFIPMILFAIVFGLSMDYEVFLLSRVREAYARANDAVESVADGLAATARVITAAAAIMVVVFGSFVLEDDRVLRMFGLGLAVAVLLDATLIRMFLVPATMQLLGARNWWMPRWLDRLLPRLGSERPGTGTGADGHHEAPRGEAETAEPVPAGEPGAAPSEKAHHSSAGLWRGRARPRQAVTTGPASSRAARGGIRQVGVIVKLDVTPGAHVRMRHIDRRPVGRERLDASANGKHPDVHRPTAQSGRDQGLVSVGPIHRDVLEQRQGAPSRAITIEEVKQYDAVVGHEHRLGRSALATQCELEDIALLHGLIAVTHSPALRITFVTDFKAG
jgi:MMPL family